MADTKITALAAITTVDPAADVLPIVDISDTSMAASGTTKKITSNQILGAGGTATLASATITGDLTVDTSTLKVDSANNRVGIGTATPAETLHVSGGNIRMSINQFLYLYYGSATNYASLGADNSGNVQVFTGLSSPANRFQIANDGVCTWSNVGGVGGTAMTLNSTGLGVGVVPSVAGENIYVRKDQAAYTSIIVQNNNGLAAGTGCGFTLNDGGTLAGWFRRQRDGTGNTDIGYKDILRFRGAIAGTERTDMLIDSSGNVISNVTGTAPTLAANSQMVFNLTSNTNLRISVRGTDGTTRVANITLA